MLIIPNLGIPRNACKIQTLTSDAALSRTSHPQTFRAKNHPKLTHIPIQSDSEILGHLSSLMRKVDKGIWHPEEGLTFFWGLDTPREYRRVFSLYTLKDIYAST